MAWRSSGTTNDEMVNNLKRFGVIASMTVEDGFRKVDRKFFVPKNRQEMAHSDQPLKEGNVHISAPHIYGSVLEALELRKDTSLSFLNAGSGTGYLTCIAATILGPRSSHYCIEIHEDVVEHCKEAIDSWKEHCPPAREICHIEIIRGNALEIDIAKGECALGFDRIYIGAALDKQSLPRFKKLLKPGGVLVGPVEDELLKVVRIQRPPTADTSEDQEFTQQVLSGVRFAPLISHPSIETIIPARVWTPSVHQYYPDSFRNSCKALLLCSHASYSQPPEFQRRERVNVASMLPRALWMEILSYAHRDWFEAPQSEIEFLRLRLAEERANAERANLARLEAETRCHLAEKERDVYRLLARRWKSRLSSTLGEHDEGSLIDVESIEEAAAAMLLGGRENISIFGLGSMLRRFRAHTGAVEREEGGDESDGENEEMIEQNEADRMEEDEEETNEGMLDDDYDDDDDESLSSDSNNRDARSALGSSQRMTATESRGAARAIAARPQVRTVSISGADL